MKFKKIIFFFFFLVSSGLLKGQVPEFSYSLYTQNDGLASGTITRIEKDSTGFVWLMSEKGLTRFDGYDFVIYRHDPNNPKSIPAHYVLDMKVNSLNEVFFRTENHITYYQHSSSTFTTIYTFSQGNEFRDWVVVDSALYVTTRSGLFRFSEKGSVITEIPITDEVISKIGNLQSDDGRKIIWLVCKNTILAVDVRLNKIIFKQSIKSIKNLNTAPILFFNTKDRQPCFFSKDGYFKFLKKDSVFVQNHSTQVKLTGKYSLVQCLDINADRLIIALMDGTLYEVDKNTGAEIIFHLSDYVDKKLALAKPSINGIYKISDQKLWISTPGSGIFYADLITSRIEKLNFNNVFNASASFPFCNYIMHDSRILWISIAGSGLIKGESLLNYFQSYKPEEKSSNAISPLHYNIRSIAEGNNNTLLLGSLNDLSIFNLKEKKFAPSLPGKLVSFGLNRISIGKIIKDKSGNFWLGAWNDAGVFKISPDLNEVVSFSLPAVSNAQSHSIRSLCIINDDLWIGTASSGLYVLRNLTDDESQIEKLELPGWASLSKIKSVYSILVRKDVVYAATGNGLMVHQLKEQKTFLYQNKPGNFESLSYNDIRSLIFDHNGLLWIGTNGGGLNSFNPESRKFRNFNTADGLPDNFIYSIAADAAGNLWLGTNNGLCCFNPLSYQTQNFSAKDQLQNLEFNTGSCLNLSTGELCFGGIDGISIFHPDSVSAVYPAANVVLTNFRIDNRPVAYELNKISLKPSENNLTFEFAALNFFRNDETRYSYILEGADRDWVFSGSRRFAHYSQLPPGDYTFYAKAMDKSGMWSQPYKFLNIYIAAPWYRTWWFYSLAALAVSGLVYVLFRFRLKQKIQVQLLRNKIARDLHDEIGSNLSSISLFSTVASDKVQQTDADVQALLKKITDFTQVSMEAMNDIVWMINTKNDRFENIISRMRTLAIELFEAKQIELEMAFDEQLSQQKMGMEERKNFYLLYKEALNNALKYSGCKKIIIRLFSKAGYINLDIIDDGRGFETDSLQNGNGLVNMEARASSLKGKLKITSIPGKGTQLSLQFPA